MNGFEWRGEEAMDKKHKVTAVDASGRTRNFIADVPGSIENPETYLAGLCAATGETMTGCVEVAVEDRCEVFVKCDCGRRMKVLPEDVTSAITSVVFKAVDGILARMIAAKAEKKPTARAAGGPERKILRKCPKCEKGIRSKKLSFVRHKQACGNPRNHEILARARAKRDANLAASRSNGGAS